MINLNDSETPHLDLTGYGVEVDSSARLGIYFDRITYLFIGSSSKYT